MDVEQYREAERRFWHQVGAPEPEEQFIELPRIGTQVRVLTVGEGPDALLLHGGPNAGSTWAPLWARLEGLRCHVVDRPGTGLSPPHPVTAASLPEFGRRFVGDALDGLGLERAHVIASSFGGHLALRSAGEEPGRFRRMVQMAAPGAVPGQRIPSFMKAMRFGLVRWMMSTLPPTRTGNRMIMRQIGHGTTLDGDGFPAGFERWYMDVARHTDTMANDGEVIGAELLPHLDEITLTRTELERVTVPTLFLWGEADGFGGPDNARSVVGMLPDADLELVPDAGHLPWLDDPQGIATATAAFLLEEKVEF